MFRNQKILAIIPARDGSKSIPNKNLCKIGDYSLVEWALFTAQKNKHIDRIIISSDSKSIVDLSNHYGDFAPFLRPKELAQDNTPSLPVFLHALNWSENNDGCQYDYIVVLEPPCPFRLSKHIDKGLDIALSNQATSVVSVVQVSDAHPIRIKQLLPNGQIIPFCMDEPEGLRRQDQEPAFIRNTAVYIFDRNTTISNKLWGNQPFGFEMDKELYGINIDEPFDLMKATFFYDKLKKEGRLNLISSFFETKQ